MFARQAMSLIELAGRTCAADPSGKALTELSQELVKIDHRYFTLLPGPCARPGGGEWTLPFDPAAQPEEAQLLWVLFELIRHGQAHQYQQIMVELSDSTIWGISLTGPSPGRTIEADRPDAHLSQMEGDDGSLWLVACPDVLFLDFESAIDRAAVFRREIEPTPLARRAVPGKRWDFDQNALESRLRAAGHPDWSPPPETPESEDPASSPSAGLLARFRRRLRF